ncbi:unnamed protein product [Auanema sp. JU1783]|nr:unnamed protein product [Auanema sp. JU1783]
MVFESLVADLLNRFLGDFVDNLDGKQLNIGIWGGDVKLENLEIKESALDDFDLPIKLKFGYLQSLVLKIPWKNLYTEPVIATVDGLDIIAVPNKGVVYNEEKIKKNLADIKQKTLARLEEARKNRRKPTDPQADTFAEKMVTQIIKNLQISVSNIHIRYEDKYTNRHRPFSVGITLESLNFKTTDENWVSTIHKEAVKVIHKLVSLQNLSVYLNSDDVMFSDKTDKHAIRHLLHSSIHRGEKKPDGFKYILEPITIEAKLKLNQKPETDGTNWSTPKIDISVDMQKLALAIGKLQYQDILLFLEAQERFNLAGQYLKYRPNLNEYRGHYVEWWKFAYNSILEEKVRRRRSNWSWKRMKDHRNLVRDYRAAWLAHQTEKNISSDQKDTISKAESVLDVFNVNIARQQAELEIDRLGLRRLEDQPQGWVAWGKSWFGGNNGENSGSSHKQKDIVSKFQEAMTEEEKSKLFEAIDYQENIPPTNYPKEFVENKFDFNLGQVAIAVEGAVALQLLHIKAAVQQRPSAKAMNVLSTIQELRMDGCGAEMLRVRDSSRAWLFLEFDTYPLSGEYDQRVELSIAPIDLKYHAPSVNNAIEVFKPPDSVKLNQLTALAMSRYEEVKARSVTGLAHAVENRSKLVLDINIEPATLLISEGGIYDARKPTIVADLGLLTIKTMDSFDENMSFTNKLDSLREQAYDKFHVKLSNVVVSLGDNYESAKASVHQAESPLHILKPTGLDIQIHKSSIDDLRLAKLRVLGDLPDIVIGISDVRLIMLLKLLNSIPKPEADPEVDIIKDSAPVLEKAKLKDRAKMKTIMEVEEVESLHSAPQESAADKTITSEQQVQVELDLHLRQIGLVLFKGDNVLCDVSISRMSCKLQMRTFDMVVLAELGAVEIESPMFNSLDTKREHLFLVDNKSDSTLMQLKFVQANPESPFFATEYNSTEQSIEFKFSELNVSLHQEALLELKEFGENIQTQMAELSPNKDIKENNKEDGVVSKVGRAVSSSLVSLSSSVKEAQTDAAALRRKERKERAMEKEESTNTKLSLNAKVGSLGLLLGSKRNGLETKLSIHNVHSDVKMTLKVTEVVATLEAITMEDCTKGALYKKLLSVTGDREMLRFEMVQYQRTDKEKKSMGPNDIDMKMKVRLAQLKFVFLNLWLCRLMSWLSPFQEEAVKAAAAAQQIASEKAAEAAQNVKQMLEQSPPRIQMDVKLHAPVLVLPRLSSSTDVVVAILGELTVNNNIGASADNKKAIMDNMIVKLTNMEFSIGSMNESATVIQSTCEILKPLTFNVTIARNLMFAVSKNVPEINVRAEIPAIEVDMSEEDYATLMHTLNGNLNEGKKEAVLTNVSAAPSAALSKEKEPEKKKSVFSKDINDIANLNDLVEKTDFSKIVFAFDLNRIDAVLYTGGGTHGEKRNTANAFAAVRLHGLKLNGNIREDDAMEVHISMNAFTLGDERKDKTKIHKLMDKKIGHEKDQLLSMDFKQSADQNKLIDLKMSAFFLCLCPEFLGAISRFFSVPPSEEEIERDEMKLKASSGPSGSNTEKTREGDAAAAPSGTITLNCDMKGVEVILVENSMEPETTQALILSFNFKMDAEPKGEIQEMKGGVEKLAIFSSYYAIHRRSEITYEVLKPIDIGIKAVLNTSTKGCDAELRMSAMEMRMSPSIIRMLSSVNEEFAKSSAVAAVASISVPKLKSYPNYWGTNRIIRKNFWFFDIPVAEEATEEILESELEPNTDEILGPIEKAKVIFERISFTLEAGTGTIPVPLVFFDLLINAEACNWSSALRASADVSMQMSYYNESFSVWEPVIEPVETSLGVFDRWSVKTEVKGKNKMDPLDTSPAMDIKIDAKEILNVTVTKSFLSLLNKLTEEFAQAAKQLTPPTTRILPGDSKVLLLNQTGLNVKLINTNDLKIRGAETDLVEASHGEFVLLDVLSGTVPHLNESSYHKMMGLEDRDVSLQLEVEDTVRELKIGRADIVAVPLNKYSEARQKWTIISETTYETGRRLVTLNSHVKVINHLAVNMEIYSTKDDNIYDLFGEVPPGTSYHLPVPLLYTPTGQIYFKPSGDSSEMSFEGVSWHDFAGITSIRKSFRCNLSADTSQGFYFESVITAEKVQAGPDLFFETYTITLYPPLEFHNSLPQPISITSPVQENLQPGDSLQLNVIAGHRLKLSMNYLDEVYSLDYKIPEEKTALEVVTLRAEKDSAELLLGINWSHEHGDLKAYLYAPFWLVNNTSLSLVHKADSSVTHNPDVNPLILPFPSTDLTKKKKACVKICGQSKWSDEFPLDTVGNAMHIICKGDEKDYELTIDIKLAQSGLTKIVTFAPFYLVSNLGKFPMEVREENQDNWTSIPAQKCVGIWPVVRSMKKLFAARFESQTEESLLFPITENIETLCEINNDNVGVNVSVATSESSVAIHLSPFTNGMAPVCIMNNLDTPLKFGQKNHKKRSLEKNEMTYFTWSSIIDTRLIEFECGVDWKGEDALETNKFMQVQLDSQIRRFVYMTSFLIGRQRTILFTTDLDKAKNSVGSWETDTLDLTAEITLHGIGLSLVDNVVGREILYMGISSSDILWEEENKKGKYKPLAVKYMEKLEEMYQANLQNPVSQFQPCEEYSANMKTMIMKKKNGKEVKIRRGFEKGIWMNYGKSSQRTRLHFKMNHLQIDNQMDGCIFSRVLAVVPPPKSVVADNAPKPFVELSLLQRQADFSLVPEIDYCRVLVQEFAVQVDLGLLNAVISLFENQVNKKPYGKEMFEQDLALTAVRLEDTAKEYKAQKPKSFYDDLHISPLMIHLSFSQGGNSNENDAIGIQSEFVNLFIKSVGVSLTELQDVVFKLGFFERRCHFYNQEQLSAEITSHYTKQFMKQLYVLVLGLDIIGNPFGLVRDLSAGVEDLFYQPFQGLIQGPEEFFQGVGFGLQSMFGHTVGGAAGAVGRIAGTVGKGVAALTFDSEYQRKRQEDINRKPQSFGEGMARGVKGLGMGVVNGLTGVVTKPYEGARTEGAKGLFKGVGKGLIGVVTRPVSGVVDFASSSMDAVRTVAGSHKESDILRPPRVIKSDHIVRPYSKAEATGFKVFKDTDRGILAETDEYIDCAQINKAILLVTNNRLVLSKRTDVMGTWVTDWSLEYNKMHEPQTKTDEKDPQKLKIIITSKVKKSGFLGLGKRDDDGKEITVKDGKVVLEKIVEAYRAALC